MDHNLGGRTGHASHEQRNTRLWARYVDGTTPLHPDAWFATHRPVLHLRRCIFGFAIYVHERVGERHASRRNPAMSVVAPLRPTTTCHIGPRRSSVPPWPMTTHR